MRSTPYTTFGNSIDQDQTAHKVESKPGSTLTATLSHISAKTNLNLTIPLTFYQTTKF